MLPPVRGEAFTHAGDGWSQRDNGAGSRLWPRGITVPRSTKVSLHLFGARLGPGRGVGLEIMESLTGALKAHPSLGTKEV